MRFFLQFVSQSFFLLILCLAAARVASAQGPQQNTLIEQADGESQAQQTPSSAPDTSSSQEPEADPVTIFPHSNTSRYWISGQANIVLQWHGSFPAKYNGPNSLRSKPENATSKVYTLFL